MRVYSFLSYNISYFAVKLKNPKFPIYVYIYKNFIDSFKKYFIFLKINIYKLVKLQEKCMKKEKWLVGPFLFCR